MSGSTSATHTNAALSPISLTQSSIGSHLLPTEEVLSLCPNIGLYSDSHKSPNQQNGTAYLTSHRVIYVDEADPRLKSGYLNLADVAYTEHFRGFLKSSPKVILGLRDRDDTRAQVARLQDEMGAASVGETAIVPPQSQSHHTASPESTPLDTRWLCPVCGFSNAAAANAPAACQLCGVKRDPTASTSAAVAAKTAVQAKASQSSAQRLPPGPTTGPEISCPTCTFLNHPSMSRCEVCDSPLGTEVVSHTQLKPPPSAAQSQSPSPVDSPATRPTTPAASIPPSAVKLSFRKGGDKAFYDALTTAMKRTAWKAKASAGPLPSMAPSPASQSRSLTPATHDIDGRRSGTPSSLAAPVGIEGLLSSYSSKSASDTSQMSDALKDLKALMSKAKDMVELAEGLEAKLRKREAEVRAGGGDTSDGEEDPTNSEAATLIRSSLVKLGLPAPAITKEMAKSEEEYHRELARELAYVLLGKDGRGGLMGRGVVGVSSHSQSISSAQVTSKGIVGLDEVWCVWNRLRGVGKCGVRPTRMQCSALN